MNTDSRAVRLGVIGTVVLILVTVLALSWTQVSELFGKRQFTAEFSEAGGLTGGETVVVSGVAVGRVSDVRLADDHVDVLFQVTDSTVVLGDLTSAVVKARTALGRKVLALRSAGTAPLRSGAVIPVSRTIPAYDVSEALSHLTRNIGDINTDQLAGSIGALSGVLNSAAPQLRPALDGVARLSQVINDRDTELSELLRHSAGVTGVLAQRDQQIQTLLADGTTLFTELKQRSADLAELLGNATDLADQVSGLVADNRRQLGPALDELNRLLATLRANKANIDLILSQLPPTARQAGEIFASFPGFNGASPNLFSPTNAIPLLPQLARGGVK